MDYFIQVPMKVKKLREDAKPLQYAHPGDSGMDVFVCALKRLDDKFKLHEEPAIVSTQQYQGVSATDEYWIIQPGETVLACSGWSASIPRGTELQVRPTSGNGLKTKMRVPNAPGTVDSIYRGEIGIELENIGPNPFILQKFAKVAQLVLCPVFEAQIEEVDSLDETDRGAAGYGSTGTMNAKEHKCEGSCGGCGGNCNCHGDH